MKPFFDQLNAAMPSGPADLHMIRRMAEALEQAARAEHAKLGKWDKSDAISGLIDNLSDFDGSFYLWGDDPPLMPVPIAVKLGGSWFHGYRKGQGPRNHGSKSAKRKMASALIAKIPFDLSRHIAASWLPMDEAAA